MVWWYSSVGILGDILFNDMKQDLMQLEGINYEQLQKTEIWQNLIMPILIDGGYKVVKVTGNKEVNG